MWLRKGAITMRNKGMGFGDDLDFSFKDIGDELNSTKNDSDNTKQKGENVDKVKPTEKKDKNEKKLEKDESFLTENTITNKNKVHVTIYMDEDYHKMIELAIGKYLFHNASDFMNRTLCSIIYDKKVPDLQELYKAQQEIKAQTKPVQVQKINVTKVEQKYAHLCKFLPEENNAPVKASKCYTIYADLKEILDEFAKLYNLKISIIIEKMFYIMTHE